MRNRIESLTPYLILTFIVGIGVSARSLNAQTPAPPPAPNPRTIHAAEPEMVAFFTGKWTCDGTFPTGKPIAATMEFAEVAGGGWFSAVHDDVPPHSYHAFALWGVAPGGVVVGHVTDNGGGIRHFVAADGWKDGRIVLVRDTTLKTGRYAERFNYVRDSPSTFRMTYETLRDTATVWRMGDTMLCTRR